MMNDCGNRSLGFPAFNRLPISPPRVLASPLLQTEFMYANPGVSVLGSAVATFNGDCVRSGQMQTNIKQGAGKRQPQRDEQLLNTIVNLPADGVQRIVRYPTDRAFLSWSLLFGCCIAHPSVILRRDRVIAAGGYDPEAEPAEDYDLWLRMDGSAPGCLANAGEVSPYYKRSLVYLR